MTQTVQPAPTGAPDTTDADFVSTVQFKSPVDHMFAALTDPSRLSRWWTKASGSGLQGGQLTFSFHGKLVIRVDKAKSLDRAVDPARLRARSGLGGNDHHLHAQPDSEWRFAA